MDKGPPLAKNFFPIGTHGTKLQEIPLSTSGKGKGMQQPCFVFLPPGTGIDQAPARQQQVRLTPQPFRTIRRGDENPLLGSGKKNPKFARVKTDRRGPCSFPRLDKIVLVHGHPGQGMSDDSPVDQIP